MQKVGGRKAGFKYLIAALLIGAAIIAWGLVYVHTKAEHMVRTYVPLMHAVAQSRVELTLGHLWFEEIVANDRNESLVQVNANLDRSRRYLDVMSEGGEIDGFAHVALMDPELLADIAAAKRDLDEFRRIMEIRWRARETSQPGSAIDQRFDEVFESLLERTDQLQRRLMALIEQESQDFRMVQLSVLLIVGLTLGLLGVALIRYNRSQGEAFGELHELNARLTKEVERRAKAERALEVARDGLEERVRARTDQLRESEERFRALVESSTDCIWETDANGVYTYVSPRIKDILGYAPEEVVGHSFRDFITPKSAEEAIATLAIITKGQEPFTNLVKVARHKDGQDVVLESSGQPFFNESGQLTGWRGIDRDATRRRAAEEQSRKLNQAVEQSADMVFITDSSGIIEYVNQTFVDLTGYSEAEAIGQNPRFLGSGDTPKAVYEKLWQTIKGGGTWRNEIKDRRKDGRVFWSSVTITPLKDDRGDITHFVSTHKDITERKMAEEATLKALRQTDIANKAKSDLIANMSHELRTPLNAILGFSETMREGVFGDLNNEQYEEYVGLIHASGAHLLDIINDILDVSALEAGRMELTEDITDVADIIDTCKRLIAHRAEDGGVYLKSDIAEDAPLLMADERRIKQILLNLLSNAVKFTEPGGSVTVSYGIGRLGRPTLSVQDTGVGMSDEELAKAMTQFGQVDSGLDRKHEGTGLGLPLAKGLAEKHGATFEVHSKKGEGTTITVSFPFDRIHEGPIE